MTTSGIQIPLFKTAVASNATLEVARILNSGYIGQGPQVELFEMELKDRLKYLHMVTLNSATSGLTLALQMMNLHFGVGVLTTPLTCTATSFAIRSNYYRPIWCDINPRTMNICLQDVRSKLTKDTRVLMLVHWGGYPVDMDEVYEIKQDYLNTFNQELFVIEDCAHAWGSKFNDRALGTFGHYGVYSFGAIKALTCGDGGLLCCPGEEETARARLLRWYGIDRNDRDCDIEEWGFKYHMNDINATIGMANLEMSEHIVNMAKRNSNCYDEQLKDIPGLKIMERQIGFDSSCWLYTILVERRHDFMRKMLDAGIEARPVHKRNDAYSCMSSFKSVLPRLDSVYKDIVCLPVGFWVKLEHRDHIINTIRKGW
jgi:dTDP-4-amino-4,6-dideoxygalactose transaminase